MKALGIAIDGGRYIRITLPAGSTPQTLRLRTLKTGQDRARLDFYKFRNGKPFSVGSRRVSGLSQAGSTQFPSVFSLRVEHSSKHLWRLSVRKKDRSNSDFVVRTGIPLWPVVLVLVAAAVFFGFLLLSRYPAARPEVEIASRLTGTEERTDETGSPPDQGDTNAVRSAAPVDTKAEAGSEHPSSTEVSEIPAADAPVTGTETLESAGATDPSTTGAGGNVGGPPAPPLDSIPPVYFSPNSARLSEAARQQLITLAGHLNDTDNLDISGHCANYGSEVGQKTLSLARANTVAAFLKSRKPSLSVAGIVGYGVSRPVTRDPERQELNRRVEIKLVIQESE